MIPARQHRLETQQPGQTKHQLLARLLMFSLGGKGPGEGSEARFHAKMRPLLQAQPVWRDPLCTPLPAGCPRCPATRPQPCEAGHLSRKGGGTASLESCCALGCCKSCVPGETAPAQSPLLSAGSLRYTCTALAVALARQVPAAEHACCCRHRSCRGGCGAGFTGACAPRPGN